MSTSVQCKGCGNEFQPRSAKQKFCTVSCRSITYLPTNRERGIAWRTRNPAAILVNSARQRARRCGVPFDLTVEDIKIPATCPILGMALTNYTGTDKKGGRFDSASIDRINPDLGYVVGNVQIISHLANMMKSSATPEQLVMFADWIQKEYT